MSEEKRKIPRLGKAAGEFNVSIGTVTTLLKKKNFDIEENPNAKLTEEMYDILLREFASEKLVKAEADKIDIGTFSAKAKSESKAKSTTKTEVREEPAEESALIIKNVNIINPPQHIETEIPTPKVLGKIELETPTAKSEEPAVEEKAEPEKPDAEAPQVPEHIETVVNLEQPKVIDKIDLDALNPKKRKSAEKKSQPKAEDTPAPEKTEPTPSDEPESEKAKPSPIPERKVEFIKTEVAKLAGPKVMGKIELPEEKPKESRRDHAADNADKKKKKRKRIIKQAGVKATDGKMGGKRDEKAKAEVEGM